jgi:putative N6-adenine-specific DNA methylase
MCGAGTLAIEAALFAEGRAPNARRRFGAERWPSFGERDQKALEELRQAALTRPRKTRAALLASDRDPDAIELVKQNAKRAGVQLILSVADVREFQPLDPPGFVVTNPPYGGRAGGGGGGKQLKTFFHALGQNARTLHGHTLCYLAGSPDFESAFAMRPATTRAMYNGPIACELLTYHVR